MSNNIEIGKHTLESLTAGMYSDAKVIYREYIQNSVDSIEKAVNSGIINKDDSKIFITVNKENNKIIIEDNGMGIPSSKAVKKLLDIGNSDKNPDSTIGFRGIGRLAGLSYCKKLKFVTSYKNENKKTIVCFNANKLERLLTPRQYTEYDLLQVINEVTKSKIEKEKKDKHYFKVILEKVENTDYILNYGRIKKYLSQIAPVPFDLKQFPLAKQIKKSLKSKKTSINEYNIFLNKGQEKKEKLFKPNSSEFIADIRNKTKDYVKDIKIETIENNNGNLIAFLWYTESNFYGTIVDDKKKGLRLRKGNIQIGDKSTLNNMFKEDRFNGWFQGEVYALDKKLIPNARRDNFEKNQTYKILISELQKIGDKLSKEIRKISRERNKVNKKKKIYQKFDYLNNIKDDKYRFKILNLIDNLTENEKEVLDKVFNIIDNNYKREKTEEFINRIVENF